MKGSTGTSMQGRAYLAKSNEVFRCNCRDCGWCNSYNKKTGILVCGRYNELKTKTQWQNKKYCRFYYKAGTL